MFADENSSIGLPHRTRAADVAGGLGTWGLHAAAVGFLLYSTYHGIHASAQYRASAGLGQAAGIAGIAVIELVIMSVYLAWHNGRIVGAPQMIAAGATYAIGFTAACLGIVADSQMQAGLSLSPWLAAYLTWGLPIMPAVMALGAVVIHESAPAQARARRATEQSDAIVESQHEARIAGMLAELQAARAVQQMQLRARQQAAAQIAAWYSSAEAQDAITRSALQDAPRLLREIGVDVPATSAGASSQQQQEHVVAHVNGNGVTPRPFGNGRA